MKKSLVAAVLALTLIAVSQRQASAWCKFSLNAGISINYEGACSGGFCFFGGGAPPCYPPPAAPCAPYPVYGAPVAMDYGAYACPSYAQGIAPRPQTSQAETMQAVYYPNQNVYPNYGYTPQYNHGFSQVPSYWYGN